MTTERLTFRNVTKRFGPVHALREVSFTVGAGAIHGLIGENGAGKSTLLKCLSGVYVPDRGEIAIDGTKLLARGPLAARKAGIAMIHQELQHVPELTVAQNLFLGRPLTRLGGIVVDRRRQEDVARQVLSGLDADIDPATQIKTLRVAQRQLVEIARALIDDAKVVAMDEPTSSLTPSEFDKLADLIRRLAQKDVSVIYVSHRMDEVFALCERATILRDGAVVDDLPLAGTSRDDVVAKMVGRKLFSAEHRSFTSAKARVALEVDSLARPPAVKKVSFKLHEGEVLGIAGLVGAGRTELVRLIAGVDAPTSGTVTAFGKRLPPHNVRAANRAGVGLLPEERKRDGIIPLRPVDRNLALPSFKTFAPMGWIDGRKLRRDARRLMHALDLRPPDVARPIAMFSGGNQQKVIIGRWLAAGAKILLFDEPTRGVDVGAKAEIYGLIEDLAREGKAIVVVSSELPELIRLADRVLVMREGELTADLPRERMNEETIMTHAVPGTASQEDAA
ncbi:MAG: sugar ABC transporter ATP-binding protein [Devosia sp.]